MIFSKFKANEQHRRAHKTLKKANQRLKQLITPGTVSGRIKITLNKEKIERENNISKIMIDKEQPSSSQSNDSKIMACMRRKAMKERKGHQVQDSKE